MNRAMPQLSDPEIERLARKRAGSKMGWYIHALMFVLVNGLFFAFSRYGFGHRPWSVFPVVGWGVGLVLHGVSVFMIGSGSRFRERLVQRERERLQREQERP
ncbi:MAG: hypothetical protein JWP41_262 [Ramlibacter sp.]|nr:hypothetical protein [Ramlibacter sp.]